MVGEDISNRLTDDRIWKQNRHLPTAFKVWHHLFSLTSSFVIYKIEVVMTSLIAYLYG